MYSIDSIDSFQFIEKELISSLNCIEEYLALYGALHLIKSSIQFIRIFNSIYLFSKKRVNLKDYGSYAGKY